MPPDGESEALVAYEPRSSLEWFCQVVPKELTVASPAHMTGDRRLEWQYFLMEYCGLSKADLIPSLANFLPWCRIMSLTFGPNTKRDANFATCKKLFAEYASTWERPSEDHPNAFSDDEEEWKPNRKEANPPFKVPDVRTWPPTLKKAWALFDKNIVVDYCLTCGKQVKDDTYGSFCSQRCSTDTCRGCQRALTKKTEEVKVYNIENAEVDNRAGRLKEFLRLRFGPLSWWDAKNREIYNEVWPKEDEWDGVEAELKALQALPRKPPLTETIHKFVCTNKDCTNPGRVIEDDFLTASYKRTCRELDAWWKKMEERWGMTLAELEWASRAEALELRMADTDDDEAPRHKRARTQ
jgi:hypothetical protein